MALSETKKGEWYIFSATFLGGFFPIIAVLSYTHVPSLISLGWSTLFAAIFFAFAVTYHRKWHELKNPLLWKYIFFVVLFIGILLYGLFFIGLETTTPGNASIINLFAVCTAFLFFNAWRHERISFEYTIGAALMVVGAGIVLVRDFSGINVGDLLILAATFCAPLGNLYQRKARDIASSETIMFLRSALSVPFIFLIAYAIGSRASLPDIWTALPFLLINGVLILGLSKTFWIESIHRMPIAKAEALYSVAPLITLFFAWLLLNQTPNIWQLASLAPLILGVLLLTDHLKFSRTR